MNTGAVTSKVPLIGAKVAQEDGTSSSIGFGLKSRRWIERWDGGSWLSGSLEWMIGCCMLWILMGDIGYWWNGGSKCRSGEEELHCSYDIVHWVRIIWM